MSYHSNTKGCLEDPTTIKRLFLSSLSLPHGIIVEVSPVSLVLTSGMLSPINKARRGMLRNRLASVVFSCSKSATVKTLVQ